MAIEGTTPENDGSADHHANMAYAGESDGTSNKMGEEDTQPVGTSTSNSLKPVFYSQLKKVAKQRVMPTLDEGDLEEVFVRGQSHFGDMPV
jgi:hypothetical protein